MKGEQELRYESRLLVRPPALPARNTNKGGVFAFGDLTPKGMSGVYTLPNKDKLCVVSKGSGYFVTANNPADWDKVKSIPVMDVRSVLSQGIILFHYCPTKILKGRPF